MPSRTARFELPSVQTKLDSVRNLTKLVILVKFQHYAATFYFRKMARFHCFFLESEETLNLNPIRRKA